MVSDAIGLAARAMGTPAGVYLSSHTPRYCTLETPVHAYGPSSGSGNYVISLLARARRA